MNRNRQNFRRRPQKSNEARQGRKVHRVVLLEMRWRRTAVILKRCEVAPQPPYPLGRLPTSHQFRSTRMNPQSGSGSVTGARKSGPLLGSVNEDGLIPSPFPLSAAFVHHPGPPVSGNIAMKPFHDLPSVTSALTSSHQSAKYRWSTRLDQHRNPAPKMGTCTAFLRRPFPLKILSVNSGN